MKKLVLLWKILRFTGTVYEVNPVLREEVERMIDAGEIDAVTFTSASTVHGFTEAMGEIDYEKYVRSASGDRRLSLRNSSG